MTRLPIPGKDDGTWGSILNAFLEVAHNNDGSLKGAAIGSAGGEMTANKGQASGYAGLDSTGIVPTGQLGTGSANNGSFLRGDGTWATPAGSGVTLASDADVSIDSGTLANNQVLMYDSTSGHWINQASLVTSVAGKLGDVVITESDVVGLTTDLSNRLTTANNLSDLSDAATARTNLGLGSAATADIGTTAGTVAAGNDSRITGAIQSSTATTKGDLLAATAASTIARLGIGTDGQVLKADSSQSTGIKWSSLAESDVANLTTDLSNLNASLASKVQIGGDLGGTASAPTVTHTTLSAALPVTQGGTGAATLSGVLKGNGTSAITGSASLSDLTVPTADFSMNTHKLTNVTDPSGAQDVATKNYVDSVSQGLDAKPSVSALSTANVTTSGTQTIDGVALVAGNRVLLTGQTNAVQNGIWVVASGSWTRPADFASGTSQLGDYVFVTGGTNNADSGWVLTAGSPIVVDTDPETWTQFSGVATVTAGTGLTKTGNTISLTNPVPINLGGTGQASQQTAINSLTAVAAGNANKYLRSDGTNAAFDGIHVTDLPAASTSAEGIVQLAGDLAGTATSPTVAKLRGTAVSTTAPTNGQVLTYNSTNTDAEWTNPAVASVAGKTGAVTLAESDITNLTTDLNAKVAKSSFTTKGDVLVGTGAAALTNVGVGTDGQVLTADSSQSSGVSWSTPTSSPGNETVSANSSASGNVNLSVATASVFSLTLTGAVTLSFSGATSSGVSYSFVLYLIQDSTGGRNVTFPAAVSWLGGIAPTLNTTPNAVSVLVFETINAGTTWYGSSVSNVTSYPLPVNQGGTGMSSLSPYQLVAGGTSANSPTQQVASVGYSGWFLTSAGGGALPFWSSLYVQEATTTILPNNPSYDATSGRLAPVAGQVGKNGSSGTNGPLGTIDGVTVATNDLILVKNEGDSNGAGAAYNGIYQVTGLGSSTTPWSMVRVPWMNTSAQAQTVFAIVKQGTTYTGRIFISNVSSPFTLNTNPITWNQLSAGGGSGTLAGDSDVSVSSPSNNQVLTYSTSSSKWVNLSPTLVNDSDVSISSPADGQVLTYNGTLSKWQNQTLSGSGGSTTLAGDTDVSITSPSNSQVLTFNSSSGKWTNQNGVSTAGATFTGEVVVPDLSVSGLSSGVNSASRYVGATASGGPASGTFAVGDFVVDQTGKVWICTIAGTPGSWSRVQSDNTLGTPADNAFLSWFMPPEMYPTQNNPANGYVYFHRIPVPRPMSVNNVNMVTTTASTNTAATGAYNAATVALYDGTGARLGFSADVGSAFGTSGLITLPLQSSASLSPGFVWAAVLFNMTTLPVLWSVGTSTYGRVNLNLSGQNVRLACSSHGPTTVPTSFTPSSYLLTNNIFLTFMALS